MKRRSTINQEGPTLFDAALKKNPELKSMTPLAERVRPRFLDEMVGQEHLLGSGKWLTTAITKDQIPSIILWGPPGSGKTTLAQVIANSTQAKFVPFNAVLGGIPEARIIFEEAQKIRSFEGRRTILFVDEIHRFNKAQQDAFLPHVERGTITLIGATTENPSFAVNAPLLSRSKVFRLKEISEEELVKLLNRASVDENGLNGKFKISEDVFFSLAKNARGDARRALNFLEQAVFAAERMNSQSITLDVLAHLEEAKTLLYDKSGEEHYNVISAFIKSMRGSDPNASIYYLMRMVEAGEDPLFLLRRMIIFASEDIGMADSQAIQVATAADAAFRRLGMPEGMYPLAHAAIYLACAPKSNSVTLAWKNAKQDILEYGALPIPMKLRNAVNDFMKKEGYGKGYKYPHDEPNHIAEGEVYLPEKLEGTIYYDQKERH